ncbi:MAG: cob(I)yrinic acid a,c-diamide adenosyltransferase [Longimicrobiales bacterium]
MVQRIYTRTGDKGETGLFGGGRVPKSSTRVEAYGEVDELNAVIGWAASNLADTPVADALVTVQADLLAVGAHLATPSATGPGGPALPRLPVTRITELEQWIDEADRELPPLDVFILPGGSPGGAALHVARTVCRRAERRVVALAEEEPIEPSIVRYLNRLSDYLFVIARLINDRDGTPERRWEADRD